ncbi:MAG: 2Fe-2S iron-sulfur cluster binding domain-containing protein [Pseudomonadota bacterium]|nr:2Fe-2S iron-sulfur cluster binding domain-containing protein [Pseudomonadota bacterium]
MENLGRRNIPVGCREGGCGVCKIEILEGRWHARVMSRAHVSEEDEAQGRVLACCVWPDSDLRLRVLGKMVKAVCRMPWEAPDTAPKP